MSKKNLYGNYSGLLWPVFPVLCNVKHQRLPSNWVFSLTRPRSDTADAQKKQNKDLGSLVALLKHTLLVIYPSCGACITSLPKPDVKWSTFLPVVPPFWNCSKTVIQASKYGLISQEAGNVVHSGTCLSSRSIGTHFQSLCQSMKSCHCHCSDWGTEWRL